MKVSAVIKIFAVASITSCFCAFAADSNSIVRPVAPKSAENIIELKITKHTTNGVEAQIINLSDDAKKMNLEKVSVIGTKVQHPSVKGAKPFTEIMWSKAAVENKTTELPSSFRSKVVANPNLNVGDKFKAKGDEKVLIEALEKMMSKDASKSNPLIRSSKSGSNTASSSADASLTGTNNTSKLSTLSSVRQNAASIGSTTTGDLGTEVTSTTGCTARVDYQLNKVFIQERTTMDGKETQSCHDSATSFTLQKDYLVCAKTISTSTGKVVPNFQYFYLDADKGTNAIDSCQPDNTKATSLAITKSYDCSDYVDLNSKTAYSQFKQSYKDTDNKDVLLTDCAIDSSKSYQVVEDFASCGIRDLFDVGYSIQQSRLYYTKDGVVVSIQSCQDTTKKYAHSTTSDTCTPVINNNQVTTFSRKYITVDGIRQYISECTPLNSNVAIKSENCTTTPYTHDFVAGQSFRNKNYFYLDQNNNRVDVSTCVKSDETFAMSEDSSVCTEESDDINMRTTVYSKKYITVDGNKTFISSCAAVSPTVAYKEIGYKWSLDYNINATSIAVGGVSDNTYLGSKQGAVSNTANYNASAGYWQQLINQFNIGGYSTTGKCTSPTSISYSGNAVDVAYSNQSTITYDNYVDQVSSAPMCVQYCYQWGLISKTCERGGVSLVCQTENNTLYYQRCTNYKCPIYKYVRKPIMQRKNGTEIINAARTLENKYTCGDNGLNGSTVYY